MKQIDSNIKMKHKFSYNFLTGAMFKCSGCGIALFAIHRTFGRFPHLITLLDVLRTFLHYLLISALFCTIFRIKTSKKLGKFWYCELESNGTDLKSFGTVKYDLESFGTASWNVMEPIWKVLVLGVGKY